MTFINNYLFKNSKLHILVYGVGAAFMCLKLEPIQFGPSRSWLRDLGLPEPEATKKAASSQQFLYTLNDLFQENNVIPVPVDGALT